MTRMLQVLTPLTVAAIALTGCTNTPASMPSNTDVEMQIDRTHLGKPKGRGDIYLLCADGHAYLQISDTTLAFPTGGGTAAVKAPEHDHHCDLDHE